MNIIYTINGEGMGHATRSSVIIDHLLAQGHRLRMFSAGRRPIAFLREKYGEVAQVMGLHMVYRNNAVKRLHTALRVLVNTPEIRKDITTIRASMHNFEPDVVITDFDFHGQIAARLAHVPVVSIDNIQLLRFADFEVAPKDFVDYELNALVARMMVPKADYFFVTTFADAHLRDSGLVERVFFVPPLLRSAVLATQPSTGNHILVYQTADSYDDLLPMLAQSGEKFIVYNCEQRVTSPTISYREFSEERFIRDLASAKAVITNGGFNVIAESLYYRKPVLSIPIKHFYEQRMNGLIIQERGCGMSVTKISKKTLEEFIKRIDQFTQAAARIPFGNDVAFKKLDSVLQSLSKARKPH